MHNDIAMTEAQPSLKSATSGHHDAHQAGAIAMSLLALGIVFGDIGTSPLYAFQVALAATGSKTPDVTTVYGIASLIIWALVVTILFKYNKLVLRADNDGEGGILALISLVKPKSWAKGEGLGYLGLLGIVGATFILGDGIITPAISVLSAMEGLKVLTPHFAVFILPLTLGIIIGLFSIQHRGTEKIGKFFGPVMAIWFAALLGIGLHQVMQHPGVLWAINPLYAIEMLWMQPISVAVVIFGAVFLALTGGEAMYADMGHVGANSIRRAFTFVVLPALIFNYLGQAATVVADPSTLDNPFFKAAPSFALFPMIVIATLATIIASQALITGSFSLIQQAQQMGLLPRMEVIQTCASSRGQIYIPVVNWLLFTGTVLIVLAFRTSDALAAAYGIAVSGTMLITTILLYDVMINRWQWNAKKARIVTAIFGTIDMCFFASNSMKIVEGGWLPLTIGAFLTYLMVAFRAGNWAARREQNAHACTVEVFRSRLACMSGVEKPIHVSREKGLTGVFFAKSKDGVTELVEKCARMNRSLPERIILCSIETQMVPFMVHDKRRIEKQDLAEGLTRVIIRHGYFQAPRVAAALAVAMNKELTHKEMHDMHYFIGLDTFERKKTGPRLPLYFYVPFVVMKKLAYNPTKFFHLNSDNTMEVGLHIHI